MWGKTRLGGDLVKVLAENYWQNSGVGNIEIYLLAVERIILVFADKIIFCWCSFRYSNRFIIKEGNSLKNCTLYIDRRNPHKIDFFESRWL